jgi:PPOX class probable F420-dependent enzyme
VALEIDTGTEFGARAERRFREELIGWLATVAADGTPQPTPVWFLWDGRSFLLYSKPGTPKLRNIERNPRVSLHLDGDGRGGDIVVVTGSLRPSDDPPANEVAPYVSKYAGAIDRLGTEPAGFAASYSVALRLEPDRLRGH